jgi:hypothetical protein
MRKWKGKNWIVGGACLLALWLWPGLLYGEEALPEPEPVEIEEVLPVEVEEPPPVFPRGAGLLSRSVDAQPLRRFGGGGAHHRGAGALRLPGGL